MGVGVSGNYQLIAQSHMPHLGARGEAQRDEGTVRLGEVTCPLLDVEGDECPGPMPTPRKCLAWIDGWAGGTRRSCRCRTKPPGR